ncbi:hypothetical protein BKA62DRAFT_714314 [Auriculariales sp. MPI-PUGE-AT-0066]|nr:hypothetical protein BKA62DRAFT_714314 [Auriculariales sp. MPI-PUGE-AT-0066]
MSISQTRSLVHGCVMLHRAAQRLRFLHATAKPAREPARGPVPVGKHRVLVTRNIGPDALDLIRARTELDMVLWDSEDRPPREWVLANARGVDGMLILQGDKIDEELLDAAGPSLRVVSTLTVGYDHVDTAALARRGILLGHTPNVLNNAVGDLALLLALMASRNIGQLHTMVLEGQWPEMRRTPFGHCGPQLSVVSGEDKRTAGFVGFGRIAHATLRRLAPLGIKTCIYSGSSRPQTEADKTRDMQLGEDLGMAIQRVALADVAKASDVVFVICPGTPETYHLIDEQFLRQMKPTAVLVNIARGTVVDSDALARALREGWIWGAGLDVVEGEPSVRKDHPLVREPRAVVLPHMGSATLETRIAMTKLAATNVVNGVLGLPMPAHVDLTR